MKIFTYFWDDKVKIRDFKRIFLHFVRIGQTGLIEYTVKNGGNIMKTGKIELQPMNEDQLEHVKKEIIQAYLFLISHTEHDPKVVEFMKLSSLAGIQRRCDAGEPW
jgi:hypothetical protein